ncbi:MAG: YgjV family protein [Clostridiales bacterium]|nr:YgjV family protein [Clostridiales bacterium]
MNYIPQIIGFIGLVFLVTSLQNNKKGIVLFFQIFANLFYGLQYILLNSLSAGLMSLVSLIRCIIFFYYEKKKNTTTPKVLFSILILCIVLIGIFTYTNISSLIPIIATILYTYAIWQKDLRIFRILTCLIACLWIIFNFNVGAYVILIGSIFELISGLIAIYRFDIKKKDIEVN